MELTDEMWSTVRTEQCKLFGHELNLENLFSGSDRPNPNDPDGRPMPVIRARESRQFPHITCDRCEYVWILNDVPGASYEAAVAISREPQPQSVIGTPESPIPLAPGVVWDELPQSHPAVQQALFEEQEAATIAHAKKAEIEANETRAAEEAAAMAEEKWNEERRATLAAQERENADPDHTHEHTEEA